MTHLARPAGLTEDIEGMLELLGLDMVVTSRYQYGLFTRDKEYHSSQYVRTISSEINSEQLVEEIQRFYQFLMAQKRKDI